MLCSPPKQPSWSILCTRPWAWLCLLTVMGLALVSGAQRSKAEDFYTLKGHGGPIMDIAVSSATGEIGSASFDNAVGVWDGREPNWLDGHEAAVNTLVFLAEARLASAGDDFSIILWDRDGGESRRLTGHTAKVMDLAANADISLLASASWDGRIGLWSINADAEPRFLDGHEAGVNAVAFSHDGQTLYSASVDGTIRIWDVATGEPKRVLVSNGFGINVMALGGRDASGAETWIAYGALDGVTRIIDIETGEPLHDFTLERRPILAMALDREGKMLATGDGQGYITLVDTQDWAINHDFRAALRGPIWALAFSADGANILAGGIEDIIYAWPIDAIEDFSPVARAKPDFLTDVAEMDNGERQFKRKCAICHALTGDGGRKAGPTLHKVFGRKAGTQAGYRYSKTLDVSNLVWTEETIDLLFDLGPDHYIPGSKMPMQRIVAQKDRADLIEYLKRETN